MKVINITSYFGASYARYNTYQNIKLLVITIYGTSHQSTVPPGTTIRASVEFLSVQATKISPQCNADNNKVQYITPQHSASQYKVHTSHNSTVS